MNTIYAIRNDGFKFQELDLEVGDFIDAFPEEIDYNTAHDFSIENLAMGKWWTPLTTNFINIEDSSTAPIPDICKWVDATLVLSPKAYRFIGETLKPFGELLPITISGDTFYIFNCLTTAEVDEQKCEKEFHQGEEVGVKVLAFAAENQEKLIFKTPYQSCMDLFCSNRLKEVITSFGLTGVIFDEKLVRKFD